MTQSLGRAVGLVISLATITLLTRQLGVESYGDFTAAAVYVGLFGVLTDVGITTILIRELGRRPGSERELVGTAFGLRCVLAAGATAVAAALAFLVYGGEPNDERRLAVLIFLPTILLWIGASTASALFQARLSMGRVAAIEVVSRLVNLGAVAFAVKFEARFAWVVVAAALPGLAFQATALMLAALRVCPPVVRVDFKAWRRLFVTSIPLGVAVILNALYFRIDAFLLSIFGTAEDVGLYGLAWRVVEIVIIFPGFIVLSAYPILSRLADQREMTEFVRVARKTFDGLAVLAILAGMTIALFSRELVTLIGGGHFEDASVALAILSAGTGLVFVNGLLGYILIAIDKQRDALWLNVAALAFNVSLNIAFIPRYGYVAAAAVAAASELLIFLGALILVRRFAQFTPSAHVLSRAAIAALPTAAVAIWAPVVWPIAAALAALVYAAVLGALGVPRTLRA